MYIPKGKIVPDIHWDGKIYTFGIDYCAEELRPLVENQRFVFNGSNGWKLINGLAWPPCIKPIGQAVFGINYDDRYDEMRTVLTGVSSYQAGLIMGSVRSLFEEASLGEWTVLQL